MEKQERIYAEQYGSSRYVVRRKVPGSQHAQYWNGSRREWLNYEDVHGGSANNPKASYFGSPTAAEKAVATATAQSGEGET